MDLRYHQPSARKACSIGVFAALLLAGAQAGSADDAPLDIFIGTLAVEKNDVILTRCDLVQNRYILRDAKGSDAVAAYARDGRPAVPHNSSGRSLRKAPQSSGISPGIFPTPRRISAKSARTACA